MYVTKFSCSFDFATALSVGFSLCDMTMNELAPHLPSHSCEFYFFFRPERLALWMSEWKVRWGLVKAEGFAELVDNDNRSQNFLWVTRVSDFWASAVSHLPARSCANFIMSWWIFCCLVFVFMKWNYHTQKKRRWNGRFLVVFQLKYVIKFKFTISSPIQNPAHSPRVSRCSDIRARKTELVHIPRWIRNGYDNIEYSSLMIW